MSNKTYSVKLNINYLDELRDAVNDRVNFSIEKTHVEDKNLKSEFTYSAWDRICAIMDRLDETIDYINKMILGSTNYKRSAFDFYEFVNSAYIVTNCIDTMAKIFNLAPALLSSVETSLECFDMSGNGNGSDKKFFNYIRSLTSVHPICTSREKAYLNKDKLHCCPYVVWTDLHDGRVFNDDRDLSVYIYNSQLNSALKTIPLNLKSFERYINKWIDLLPAIINCIKSEKENKVNELVIRKIKDVSEFDNYADYISNLKKESVDRFGDGYWMDFDYLVNVMNLKITNSYNQSKLDLYINAIKHSMKFLHASMQSMNDEGYENTGIISDDENNSSSLIDLLESPRRYGHEDSMFGYNVSKIHHLKDDSSGDHIYNARICLKELKPFLSKFVDFSGAWDDFEKYTLVQIALYLDCLENKCELNINIPNDLAYREKLLTDAEIIEFNAVDEIEKEATDRNTEIIMKMLDM